MLNVRQFIISWVVPAAAVAIAAFVTSHNALLQNKMPMSMFLSAVLVSIWFGGWVGGIVATAISAAVTAWHMSPANSFYIGNPDDLIRWSFFILVAVMTSSLYASRTKAESALRRSEQRMMVAIDSARMGVWDYNLLTRKLWWSQTLETIYGRTAENFPATYGQFFGCIHFDDQPLFNRAVTRTIDEGNDYEIEHRIILPDKSIRWLHTRGRVFFNDSGRAERIVGVTVDISARKQAEEENPPRAKLPAERVSSVG